MLKGKVKFYHRAKEFGFITAEDGQDYYFNAASLLAPDEGDEVVFELQESNKGLMARKVKCVSGAVNRGGRVADWKYRPHVWVVGGIVLVGLGMFLGWIL